MFAEKTVLILGAGASWHFNYPTGKELIDYICVAIETHLFNDIDGRRVLKNYSDYRAFHEALRSRLFGNIDSFLCFNQDMQKIGKTMMVYSILAHENRNLFKGYNSRGNWYQFIIDTMCQGCENAPDKIFENQLSIITFNYDLSLEFYLSMHLPHATNFKDVAHKFIKDYLPIIHIYGSLYDWERYSKIYGEHFITSDVIPINKTLKIAEKFSDNISVYLY